MQTPRIYLFFLSALFLVVSCGKDDGPDLPSPSAQPTENPTEEPLIEPETEADNQVPEISAQSFTALEDVADDIVIGEITATDADEDNLTFTLVQNSDDLFEITEAGALSLAADKELDFEVKTAHEITVQVSDSTDTAQAMITVTVEDVDDTEVVAVSEDFITTWETTTANETVTVPVLPIFVTYDYDVDWGDGNISTGLTADAVHVYETAGNYDISITGKYPGIFFGFAEGDNTQIKDIKQWGNIEWETLRSAFYLCTELQYSATDKPDLSKVNDLSNMFGFATVFNGDISDWDTSTIENMAGMFQGTDAFTGDISVWDVSKVEDMSSMFARAVAFNSDLNNWDVSSVTDMSQMFSGATVYNKDLDKWDVSNVTNMGGMFAGTGAFNADITTWNVSSVTDMYNMFFAAQAFNGAIGSWNVNAVTDTSGMFDGAIAFNGNIGTWNVSSVTYMESMFDGATAFNADINTWDVSHVDSMENMFTGATSFNQNLNSWDVASVSTMAEMFSEATAFNGDISSWNTAAVDDMDSMFESATSFNGAIGTWDVGNVLEMYGMFEGATSFDQNLGAWNIGSVSDMSYMLDDTNLSIANYDATLKGWSELTNVPSDITLDASGLSYCDEGEAARNILIGLEWDIEGDSKSTTCN